MDIEMRSTIKNKIDWYIEKITVLGFEFNCLKVWTTAGDIRPPYPFQYQALTKLRKGEDDAYDGLGGTPLEAVKSLYKTIKELIKEE
ncbi:hypothetical protein LCGC14_2377880 [marine sediment metagenome]|uniref:Uncharacterized protein n=1 Tax=marine sediment metagenome TaxID=412755 RepID=A0A0F9C1X7_9ZZZZ